MQKFTTEDTESTEGIIELSCDWRSYVRHTIICVPLAALLVGMLLVVRDWILGLIVGFGLGVFFSMLLLLLWMWAVQKLRSVSSDRASVPSVFPSERPSA